MPTIHLFLRAMGDDYQILLRDDCTRAAAAYGADVRVWSAENDSARQVLQIEEAMGHHSDPLDSVLVSPVREVALLAVACKAAARDLPFVILNRDGHFLDEVRAEFPAATLFAINPDQREIGRLHGMQLKRLLPHGGNVLYVQGTPMTSSARDRSIGMQDELDDSALDVVMTYGDWSFESGRRAAIKWATKLAAEDPSTLAVCAQNDAMAMGAREVLLAAAGGSHPGLERVPVLGCDGSPAYGRRHVCSGDLAATILVPPAAAPAIDTIMKVHRNEMPPPSEVSLPVSPFPDLDELHPSSAV